MKKRPVFLVLLLCLSILITGCGAGENAGTESSQVSSGEAVEKQNVVLRIGALDDFKVSGSGRTLVFDPLTRLDKDMNPVPYLVSWESDPDQKEYKLTLKEGVKFHDGKNLEADSILWDIQKLGAIYYCGYANYLDEVKQDDTYSLTVKFKQSYPRFPAELSTILAMPVDNMSEDFALKSFNGTGPFCVEEYVADQTSKLKRNENYWNKDKLPQITNIEWIPIADGASRTLALKNGQVDVVGLTDGYNTFAFNLLNDLEKDQSVSMIVEPSDHFTSANCLGLNWQKGVLKDINLRAAVCYGINRGPLVKNILFDIPKVVDHYIGDAYWDAPSHYVEGIGYDPEKSKEFLEKGGYKSVDGKITKDGKVVKLNLVISDSHAYKDVGQYIKSELEKMGFECDLSVLEYNQAFEKQKKLEYDATISWPWYEPVADALPSMGLTKEYNSMGLGGMVSDKMQEYADEFYAAKNREEAKPALKKIWQLQYDSYLAAPLYATTRITVHNKKFDGYIFDPCYFQLDLSELHLAENK